MNRLNFSALARDDLLEIARHIARDNPQRAQSFVDELRTRCTQLAKNPGLGIAKPEYAEGLRMFPHERYLIFFSISDQGILIERVLHSARNLYRLLDSATDSGKNPVKK